MKTPLRAAVFGLVVGLVALGSALAGIVIAPPQLPGALDAPDAADVRAAAGLEASSATGDIELTPEEVPDVAGSTVKAPSGGLTPAGTFLVGAARASLTPSPTTFGGQRWQTEGCTSIDDQSLDTDHALPALDPADPITSLDDIRSWPATGPDCIYIGGNGIGPARYAKAVGHGGVWVRALAISNGEQTFAYAIADVVGWFARYDATICSDCGIRDVRERLASDLNVDIGGIVIGSTHTHAGADTYGGWGGIPKWYRNQIRDSAVAAVKQAVSNLEPSTLRVGEAQLRNRNNERRDTYYSTVDTAAPWIQATSLPTVSDDCGTGSASAQAKKRKPKKTPPPTATPCTPAAVPGKVIATFAAFAAHPTIVGGPVLHADWPGAAARRFEAEHGGVGVMFEGGLGNASVSGLSGETEEARAEATGAAIADGISATIDNGETMSSNDLAMSVQDMTHPVDTNLGLVTFATAGFFDREFLPTGGGADVPGVYHWSKAGEASTGDDNDITVAEPGVPPKARGPRGCTSAGPALRTTVGAHRIGTTLVAFTPGEIFSNVAEVIKERADRNSVAMVLGQSNDALGYIIQSFEFDTAANVPTHYGTGAAEYEEVFAVDRCFGDHVLETALESTDALGFGR